MKIKKEENKKEEEADKVKRSKIMSHNAECQFFFIFFFLYMFINVNSM